MFFNLEHKYLLEKNQMFEHMRRVNSTLVQSFHNSSNNSSLITFSRLQNHQNKGRKILAFNLLQSFF